MSNTPRQQSHTPDAAPAARIARVRALIGAFHSSGAPDHNTAAHHDEALDDIYS